MEGKAADDVCRQTFWPRHVCCVFVRVFFSFVYPLPTAGSTPGAHICTVCVSKPAVGPAALDVLVLTHTRVRVCVLASQSRKCPCCVLRACWPRMAAHQHPNAPHPCPQDNGMFARGVYYTNMLSLPSEQRHPTTRRRDGHDLPGPPRRAYRKCWGCHVTMESTKERNRSAYTFASTALMFLASHVFC